MWSPSSPSWHVTLAADRLAAANAAAYWPGKFGDFEVIQVNSGGQTAPWQPAVTELAAWLAKKTTKKPSLRVVLSGRFVRWQLLPWQAQISHPDELVTFATLKFRETFGQAVEDWEVILSPQPPGKPALACAVDSALLDALRTTCNKSGAKLVAVSPYFSVAFDRWRYVFRKKTAWFGLIESDCVTVGLLSNGQWSGLRTERVNMNWQDALPAMMAQIGICADVSDAALPIFLVGDANEPVGVNGLSFTWLKPKELLNCVTPGGRLALGF